MFVPPVTMIAGYYYDLPQLFLMTLGVLLLHRRHWAGYFTVLAIASLNKETAAFLVVVFCIHQWRRMPRGAFLNLLGWQGTIVAVIRITTSLLFLDNAGASLVFTVPDQMRIYSEHPFALAATLACFGIITYLVLRQWHSKNEFLRSTASIGRIILVSFIPFGYPLEFRVFLDALPVLGVLVFPPGFIKA